jgi:hypothetical protein
MIVIFFQDKDGAHPPYISSCLMDFCLTIQIFSSMEPILDARPHLFDKGELLWFDLFMVVSWGCR